LPTVSLSAASIKEKVISPDNS